MRYFNYLISAGILQLSILLTWAVPMTVAVRSPLFATSQLIDAQATAALLRPRVDFSIIARDKEGRKLQSSENLCDIVISTVFAEDPLSLAACSCALTKQDEYTLSCDYSNMCGTFCTDRQGAGAFKCFDRIDTYTILATAEYFINTNYEGCGTYQNGPETKVCYTETRDMQGLVSGRCLEINDSACQCTQGSCGNFVFQCNNHGPESPWKSFVLDECDENAYNVHV